MMLRTRSQAWAVAAGTLWLMSAMNLVYAAIVVTGALLMRRLRARMLVLPCVVVAGIALPSVLAFNVITEWGTIPQWPILIPTWLGMPVAVWAAVVLLQPTVRAAFDAESMIGRKEGLRRRQAR